MTTLTELSAAGDAAGLIAGSGDGGSAETTAAGRLPVVPGNAGHPLDEAPLPYWLSEPCPPWCVMAGPHDDGECYEERLHQSASRDITLTLEPQRVVEAGGKAIAEGPAHLNAGLWQHYRERAPYITVIINDGEEINLELAEAAAVARLLVTPSRIGAQVALTMMDPDLAMPPLERRADFIACPFNRVPVLAVRQSVRGVTVFCPVRHGGDQGPRWLALTPGEAAELAAAVTSLLDDAR